MWRIIYIKKPKNLSKEQLQRIKNKWYLDLIETRTVKTLLSYIFPESEWEIVEILPQELFSES